MEERQKKAFDFASDLTKQLITLSTAIITLSIAFLKDMVSNVNSTGGYLLLLSWTMFFLSILFGILTLMALTGNLDPMVQPNPPGGNSGAELKPKPILTINTTNIRTTSLLQVFTFLLALVFFCIYGYGTISSKANPKPSVIVRNVHLNDKNVVYTDTLFLTK